MQNYKTLNEAKKNLPEIIDRINACKDMFDCSTMMLKGMEDWCVEESIDETKDYRWWTTIKAYAETVKNQMSYLSEMEYLQGIVEKLKVHPNI